ncbi:MAG TPA: hypothetical protein VFV81_01945 [Verrucomicrobiae bacterium]|nr:hypothetical protein [Verrucomicrobiae bacterium]
MKLWTVKGRHGKSKPFLQFIAGAMLLVWVAALTACSSHCSCSCSPSESANAMHGAAPHGPSPDSDHDHDDSFCRSLHSLSLPASGGTLAKPDFGSTFALSFISTALLPAPARPEAPVSRQPPDGHRVFTPELCLGPAFRSLAPPRLA